MRAACVSTAKSSVAVASRCDVRGASDAAIHGRRRAEGSKEAESCWLVHGRSRRSHNRSATQRVSVPELGSSDGHHSKLPSYRS
jgi:hypothetical protein